MSRDYAIAIAELINAGLPVDEALTRLQTLLTKRGHGKLYPAVLTALLREVEKSSSETSAVVTVARASDAKSTLITKLMTELSVAKDSAVSITVDETLIGGAKLRANGEEIDASYKKALLSLYQAVIK